MKIRLTALFAPCGSITNLFDLNRSSLLVAFAVATVSAAALVGCSNGSTPTPADHLNKRANAPVATTLASPVELTSCSSRALRIDLNVNDQSTKSDLLAVFQILAKYTSLRWSALEAPAGSASLRVMPSARCEGEACALNEGWMALQKDLAALPGLAFSCDTSISADSTASGETCDAPSMDDAVKQDDIKQDEPKQDEPKQDEGSGGEEDEEAEDEGGGVIIES